MSSKERKRKGDSLKKLILIKLIETGYSKKQLAVFLGISLASLYNRLNNPDSFTYKELQALFHYLKFTPEEQAQAI
jgi:transposase